MKTLLTMTALIEVGAGLALLGFPSEAVKLLLGSPLDSAPAIALGRVAGAALFSLGIACWLAHGDTRNCAARGLVAAMTFYNFAAVAVFLFAGLGAKLAGVALWPAIILHAAMAVWCLLCLWQKSSNEPISKQIT
jgi:hypothetical protein